MSRIDTTEFPTRTSEVDVAFDRDPGFEELRRRLDDCRATIEEATELLRQNVLTTEEFAERIDSL